jgi:SAM-dependent methyltransferase
LSQDAIWDYFQNEGVARFAGSLARLRFIARRFEPGTRVLNIGVGAGFFEKEALSRSIDVHSLDPSARSLQHISDDLQKSGRAKVGYCEEIPWPMGYFDGVVLSEVLEHLSDEILVQALSEVLRVLKAGGLFCGTVPARERLQENVVVCPCCRSKFHRWGHLQSFDCARIRTLLEQDYDVVHLSERDFVTWGTLNWKGRIRGVMRIVLRALGTHGSGETIYFSARKLNGHDGTLAA